MTKVDFRAAAFVIVAGIAGSQAAAISMGPGVLIWLLVNTKAGSPETIFILVVSQALSAIVAGTLIARTQRERAMAFGASFVVVTSYFPFHGMSAPVSAFTGLVVGYVANSPQHGGLATPLALFRCIRLIRSHSPGKGRDPVEFSEDLMACIERICPPKLYATTFFASYSDLLTDIDRVLQSDLDDCELDLQEEELCSQWRLDITELARQLLNDWFRETLLIRD